MEMNENRKKNFESHLERSDSNLFQFMRHDTVLIYKNIFMNNINYEVYIFRVNN